MVEKLSGDDSEEALSEVVLTESREEPAPQGNARFCHRDPRGNHQSLRRQWRISGMSCSEDNNKELTLNLGPCQPELSLDHRQI